MRQTQLGKILQAFVGLPACSGPASHSSGTLELSCKERLTCTRVHVTLKRLL